MTLPNLPTTIETTNTQWLRIARPIILAMFAVDDATHSVTTARLADPKGYAPFGKMSYAATEWQEAQSIIGKAYDAMSGMLGSIRDNCLCDAYVNVDYDADEATIDAAEAFNEDLAPSVMSVDAAVRMIGDEA